MDLSLDDIAEVLTFIQTLDCTAVEITVGDVRLAVRKNGAGAEVQLPPTSSESNAVTTPTPAVSTPPPLPSGSPRSPESEAAVLSSPGAKDASEVQVGEFEQREAAGEVVVVRSPMVGAFYRAKEPGVAPFVEVGSRVEKGDVLCLVEVMKLFHSVGAEASGVIEAIFVEDSSMVEYGQPLMALSLSNVS